MNVLLSNQFIECDYIILKKFLKMILHDLFFLGTITAKRNFYEIQDQDSIKEKNYEQILWQFSAWKCVR